MQHRLMTEYEWRKQLSAVRRRQDWVGAQCVYPPKWRRMLHTNRLMRLIALMLSGAIAMILPLAIPENTSETFDNIRISENPGVQARQVSAVSYALPRNMMWESYVFTREQLLRGKMLLLDEAHPLPEDAPPPNTAGIAKYGNGMVPVRSLSLKAGRQTIDALSSLFAVLREKGIEGIYVCQGTTTAAEQQSRLVKSMRMQMRLDSPDHARQTVLDQMEWPGFGELLQEYTVGICLMDAVAQQQDERLLEESAQGQMLLQYAWRHGFVRSDAAHPDRFRYVGKAHATAMTYLDLPLAAYLEWLHQKEVLVISAGGRPQYLILCQPMLNERIAFDLPSGAEWEASLDNTGYAVVACTL